MKDYKFYIIDTETTGLDPVLHDVIEFSIIRMEDNVQKTWFIKPIGNNIDSGALRTNGHKLEDITWKTPLGRQTYKEAKSAIIEIENWLMNDGVPAKYRFLIAHNIRFDMNMLEQLWIKCDSKDNFPFGRRYLDTMIIELFLSYCKNEFAEGYSLANLCKMYNVKNEKAHTALADTKTTKEIFIKQANFIKNLLTK
jgi:DNA polymerase-3 subunit epsilon